MATNIINDLSAKPKPRPVRRTPEAPPLDLRGRHHEYQVEPSQHVINLVERPTMTRQRSQGRFYEAVPSPFDAIQPDSSPLHDEELDWTDRLVDAEAKAMEQWSRLHGHAERFRMTGEPWQIIAVGLILGAFVLGVAYVVGQVLPAHT